MTFKDLSSEEVISRLDGARIANARMRTVQEFLDHPQLEAWRPAGEVDSLVARSGRVPPVTMQGVESVMEPIPEVGEHTDAIPEELDLDPDAVGSLREAGAVRGSRS